MQCKKCGMVMKFADDLYICLACGGRYELEGNQWVFKDDWSKLEKKRPGFKNYILKFFFPDFKPQRHTESEKEASLLPQKSRPPGWGTA